MHQPHARFNAAFFIGLRLVLVVVVVVIVFLNAYYNHNHNHNHHVVVVWLVVVVERHQVPASKGGASSIGPDAVF